MLTNVGLRPCPCHNYAMKFTNNVVLGACLALLLAGCSGLPAPTDSQSGPSTEEEHGSAIGRTSHHDAATEPEGSDPAIQSDGNSSVSMAAPPAPPPERPIPTDSLYPLLKAEFALREQHYDTALELLTAQAMQLEDAELARRALRLAEYQEQSDKALAMAMRLTELDGDDAAAAATAMALLLQRGDAELAVSFARKAKERGSRINAPALMVDYNRRPEASQRALAAAIEALAADWPEDNDIGIALALLRREQDRLQEALSALEGVLTRTSNDERALVLWTQTKAELGDSDAFTRIDDALAAKPDNEGLRLQYARLLASDNRIDDARQQFQMLQELSPRNGDYSFSLALIELESGNPELARQHLRDLLALEQRVDEAWYYLGRVAEELGDIDGAINAYGNVGPSREFFDALRRAATLLLDDGDSLNYSTLFSNARDVSPGQAEQLFAIEARLLVDRGTLQRAIEVYDRGLSIFQESLALQYGRAMAHEAIGDIAAMEADLRAIIEREPNNATALNALGYTLTTHTNRYEEAALLIERALALSPGEAAILDSLGWVYFKQGRFQEALVVLTQAYEQLPDPEVAAHLGETLWTLGRHNDALTVWRAALGADASNRHITNTLKRLGIELSDR